MIGQWCNEWWKNDWWRNEWTIEWWMSEWMDEIQWMDRMKWMNERMSEWRNEWSFNHEWIFVEWVKESKSLQPPNPLKHPKIQINTIIAPISEGGLGMVDISCVYHAAQISWIRRLN